MIFMYGHPYIPNSSKKIADMMMQKMNISSIDDLFADIPQECILKKPLNIPHIESEIELIKYFKSMFSSDLCFHDMRAFIGAGCWPHYIPPVVKSIVSRAEFLTAYTPYQSEIAQGLLQALFEYQSILCELTGMEVANASMYDWPTALAEAALMSYRVTNKKTFIVPYIIHPDRKSVLKTYVEPHGIKCVEIMYDRERGILDLDDLKSKLNDDVSAVYVEIPSYFGFIDDQVYDISDMAHSKNALFIVGVDPISLGILKAPGDYGADIVVGEAQPLGNPINFGGPLIGIFACKDESKLIRNMPGRLIGITTTKNGSDKGFTLVLQTREQHIRREKATSNICTNEALCAIAAVCYLSLLGGHGLKRLGETILYKTSYAIKKLNSITNVKAPLFKNSLHFKEFVVNIDDTGKSITWVHKQLLRRKIHGGKIIVNEYPEFGNSAIFCFTELHSNDDIDLLVNFLEEILGG